MDYKGATKHILDRLEQELPAHLTYHGHHHTIDVMEATERIGRSEGLNEVDLRLALVAAAYHDCGFLYGHKDHELKGCEIARELLPQFGFTSEEVDQICRMIMATKVPQEPKDQLSQILCDADLDYLGREDFEAIATNLFHELRELKIVETIESWNRIQLSFLAQHSYHTNYGKEYRQLSKQMHLERIRSIVSTYDN
ncbi:MAG: HD domain-containing protein [Flavobacteriales bacterium]|nr:HD domain-containing protein [Flavobacteriales bacterium]